MTQIISDYSYRFIRILSIPHLVADGGVKRQDAAPRAGLVYHIIVQQACHVNELCDLSNALLAPAQLMCWFLGWVIRSSGT